MIGREGCGQLNYSAVIQSMVLLPLRSLIPLAGLLRTEGEALAGPNEILY
jgi:hypothetical protein